MKAIIKKDMPINRLTIDRLEAIKYFKEVGDESKAGAMRYNTDNYITLYRLGNIYNYFYYLMPQSTGKLKDLKRQNDFSDNDMMLDYYDLSSDRKKSVCLL